MANISEYLQKIKEARYGKDVRSSIYDGIKAINEEVEANTLASNEAVESANNAAKSADLSAKQATESANLAQASASSAAESATSAESANNTVNTFVTEKTTEITEALQNVQTQADTRLNSAEQKYNELSDQIKKQITDKIGIDDTQASTTTTYSSDKIDKLLKAIGGVAGLDKEIVQELPTSDIKDNTLYLVPSATSETNNVYDEYIYIDGSWEIIGSTAVDLTNYYKKNEVDTLLEDKVSKEEGKGLFSGSYKDLKDVPTNLATLSDLEKYLKANDDASFYFGVLNHKFGYYTTEAREESDFHEFGSSGFHVPPKDVYNVSIKASDGALTVSWNDPDDTFIEGVDISHWAGTILVMKADSAPVDENDGTVVLTNTVRNQYATEGYVINGLTNNTTYHLYFIPYNQEGDYEYSDNNRYTGMPAKVMLDDVTDISTSGADGSVTVNWTNPEQTKEQDGITATWVKTTVVIKADSQPTSASDGTAYDSTDYSENSHTFTVENGKDYYVGFFVESDLGSVTHTTYDTATSLYATVTVSTEETTLIGKTVTATYGDSGSVSGEISSMGFVQLKIPYIGEVTLTATDGTDTATSTVAVESFTAMAVDLSFLKIVTFADGTDEEIDAMLEAHYADKINISDYWAAGDERTAYTDDGTEVNIIAIVGFDLEELVEPINGHTTAAITVIEKNSRGSTQISNATITYTGYGTLYYLGSPGYVAWNTTKTGSEASKFNETLLYEKVSSLENLYTSKLNECIKQVKKYEDAEPQKLFIPSANDFSTKYTGIKNRTVLLNSNSIWTSSVGVDVSKTYYSISNYGTYKSASELKNAGYKTDVDNWGDEIRYPTNVLSIIHAETRRSGTYGWTSISNLNNSSDISISYVNKQDTSLPYNIAFCL